MDPYAKGKEILDQRADASRGEAAMDLSIVITPLLAERLDWELFAKILPVQPELKKRRLESIRARIVLFRDIFMDTDPFDISEDINPVSEGEKLRDYVSSHRYPGAGRNIGSALEAMYCAMNRVPEHTGNLIQIVAVFTDEEAYLPENRIRLFDSEYDPILKHFLTEKAGEMPRSLSDFRREWRDGIGNMDNWNQKLLIISPDISPWNEMTDWKYTRIERMDPGEITAFDERKLAGEIAQQL